MPALLVISLLPVQTGLWWHAKQAAAVAAEQAVNAAQVPDGTPADGQRAAETILSQAGNLTNRQTQVQRSADRVVVTVSGQLSFSVLPGAWRVTANADGPVEQFVSEAER